jgi:large subunit ribosomal protein L13
MPGAPVRRAGESPPNSLMHATTHVRSATLPPRWLVYDASKFTLGRMAAQIAMNLMGKDAPTWTPSEKNGAFVVVVNAEKVRVTGKKSTAKTYARYSGYPGGRRETLFEDMRQRKPEEIVILAVQRMLPKTVLGRDLRRRLKVYAGPDHPHAAQQPVAVEKIRS